MRSPASRQTAQKYPRRLLDRLIRAAHAPVPAKRGRLLLESLEKRQMLAADSELLFTDGAIALDEALPPAETSVALPVAGVAEGEPARDLVQFAKDLTAAGVQFFGAHWCPACTLQKEYFDDGKDNLPFIEVTGPDRQRNEIGIAEGIFDYPTWEFPNGSRVSDVLTIAELSQLSGVPIPQSEQPTFESIGNQTVLIGSPLHIPVDAYDPNGGTLTVTVSVDEPTLLTATVLQNNRSIRIDMETFGDMVFELFEQRAPVPAGRVADLAGLGFYDGIIFHRVVDNFVIQAGDPTGTGRSGSTLDDFDDQFHPDLQHNRSGVLSFAKSTDDTNNSQFFVTELATRGLDFNHSIFGQLVEGEDVREAISEMQVDANGKPSVDIKINTIEVFEDIENSVVMLKAVGSNTGSTNVTFTVRDQQGNTHSETILVTVANDTANGQPYLNPISPPSDSLSNTSAQLQLSSFDVEGDAVTYFANGISSPSGGTVSIGILTARFLGDPDEGKSLVTVTPASGSSEPLEIQLASAAPTGEAVTFFLEPVSGAANGTVSINETTGLVTVTPNASANGSIQFRVGSRNTAQAVRGVYQQSISSPTGTVSVNATSGLATVTPAVDFDGSIEVQVGVRPDRDVTGNAIGDSDLQMVAFAFDAIATPTAVDLQTASDTGSSNIDNITNADSLTFTVTGVTSGATVELVNLDSGSVVGTDIASGTSIEITTNNIAALGDGTYPIAARQRIGNDTGGLSPSIVVVYDTIAPDSVVASAATSGNLGRLYETDLINSEEGSGLVYQLVAGPSSAMINAATGQIQWTPFEQELGDNTFTLELTDAAGNTRSESFTVTVAGEPLAEIRLDLTDLQGNPITSVAVGDKFLLNLIAVDARLFNKPGVFSAYADILFDSSIVRVEQGSTITFSDDFTVERKGTFLTGLIDELGAVSNFLAATNDPENLIATVRMEALASGTVNIRSESADESDSDVLLFFEDERIPADAVFYGDTSLAVGQTFIVAPDTLTVAEDSGATIVPVLANDQIISGSGSLSVISFTQPSSGGTVSLIDGIVRFTPTANFNGTSVFTYRVNGPDGIQQDSTVTVTVTPVNDPPTAVDNAFNVNRDSTGNTLDLLGNDLIAPDSGESLRITAVGTTSNGGSVIISGDGQSVSYTPVPGFTGTETFSYTMSDRGEGGGGLTDSAEVTVTVSPIDNPPTAVPDAFPVTEDALEAPFDVLFNDTRDVDNQSFVLSSVGTPSQGGTARIDGSMILYRPAANFSGTEQLTYTIRDSGGGLAVGTVTFTVSAVPDPPPFANPTVNLTRGSAESTVYQIGDLPPNPDPGETLSFDGVSSPTTAGGTVRRDAASQAILYTPPSAEFTGQDTFTYTVSDGSLVTSTGTVTINVVDFTERDIVLELASMAAHSRVGGITLKGTNLLGDTVEVPLAYSGGSGRFENVLPGDYTIDIPAIPFLQNAAAARQIAITSAVDDGDATVPSLIGRLRPEYISIRDWVGSAPRRSLLVAVAPGQTSALTIASSAIEIVNDPVVNLNTAGDTLTIQGTQTTDFSTDSDPKIQLRGEVDGMRLYKVTIDEELTFTPPANAGEGEASSAFVLGDIQAEAEAPAALATTQADLFVPVASDSATRTDAAVLALPAGDLWVGATATSDDENAIVDTQSAVDSAMRTVSELSIQSAAGDVVAEDARLDQQLVDQALYGALAEGL